MFDLIVEFLKKNEQRHDFWTDGDYIVCSSLERANTIADLLEDCGEDIVCTGSYDENDEEFYIRLNGM